MLQPLCSVCASQIWWAAWQVSTLWQQKCRPGLQSRRLRVQDPTPEPRLPSTRNGKQLVKLAEVLGAGRPIVQSFNRQNDSPKPNSGPNNCVVRHSVELNKVKTGTLCFERYTAPEWELDVDSGVVFTCFDPCPDLHVYNDFCRVR